MPGYAIEGSDTHVRGIGYHVIQADILQNLNRYNIAGVNKRGSHVIGPMNFSSKFLGLQNHLPEMDLQEHGSIVNTVAGVRPLSKAAV